MHTMLRQRLRNCLRAVSRSPCMKQDILLKSCRPFVLCEGHVDIETS